MRLVVNGRLAPKSRRWSTLSVLRRLGCRLSTPPRFVDEEATTSEVATLADGPTDEDPLPSFGPMGDDVA